MNKGLIVSFLLVFWCAACAGAGGAAGGGDDTAADAVEPDDTADAMGGSGDDVAMDATPSDTSELDGEVGPAEPDAADAVEDDEAPLAGFGPESCAPYELITGRGAPERDCLTRQSVRGHTGSAVSVRVDCTDPSITALIEKQHLVMVPDEVTRPELWVHFGGSGGQPALTSNIGTAATTSGYRFISLAYTNEPSIGARCTCPSGASRPLDCEEGVRAEIIYGDDVTDMFVMEPDEAIVPRLVALLNLLHERQPAAGWDAYLVDGAPTWDRIAVSGFSQGGGMAGLIARDHLVARAVYFSKGAGAVNNVLANPDEVSMACASAEDCERGRCCSPDDPTCESLPPDGGVCIYGLPAPYASTGRDVDGDRRGDADASLRATPPERQFAIVHRSEGAWEYSPDVFELWGMGSRDDFFDADEGVAPPAGTRLFSTDLPPLGACSEHQSIGSNPCQARLEGSDVPAMFQAWQYMMTAPVE